MTKQEKNDFLEAGGTLLRLDKENFRIKAKTKWKDWHTFLNYKESKDLELLEDHFEFILEDKPHRFKTDMKDYENK